MDKTRAALTEQIDALLAINKTGNATPRVPGLAVELLARSREALAALDEGAAREECARRGIDPDEICADGGVEAWMVVAKEMCRADDEDYRQFHQREIEYSPCDRCALGPCPFFHEDGSAKR